MSRPDCCDYYSPCINTSHGEINNACVDYDKRVIARCDYNPEKGCWKFKKGDKNNGTMGTR